MNARSDPTPTKKSRKQKDLPSGLSELTEANIWDKINGRYELGLKESGKVMVAHKVTLDGNKVVDLTTLTLDQLQKFVGLLVVRM